jgi:hypothetical protein
MEETDEPAWQAADLKIFFGAGGRISRNLPSITYIGQKYFLGRWERNEKCAVITNRGVFSRFSARYLATKQEFIAQVSGQVEFRQILRH